MSIFKRIGAILSAVWWGFVISPICDRVSLPILGKGGFVFIVHPRVIEDVLLQFPFFAVLSKSKMEALLRKLPPVIGPRIDTGNGVRGRVVFVPQTVEMMNSDRLGARDAIVRAAQTANRMGAKYIGTGALTASMTRLGFDLRNVGPVVTTGHAATSLIGAQMVLEGLVRMGIDPGLATVAVVGVGSIGQSVATILAKQVARLILIDVSEKIPRLNRLSQQLDGTGVPAIEVVAREEGGYSRLIEADAIFTATSESEAWLTADMLKRGSMVVDDSAPFSMSQQEAEKHDGLVLQVLAMAPGVDCHFWFSRGVGRRYQYTCLAELIALAHHGNGTKGVIGPVTLDAVSVMSFLLQEAGYDGLVFTSFGVEISEAEWERARAEVQSTPPTWIVLGENAPLQLVVL